MQPVAVFTGTGATPGQARALLAAKCMVNHHRLHVVCRHADGRDGKLMVTGRVGCGGEGPSPRSSAQNHSRIR